MRPEWIYWQEALRFTPTPDVLKKHCEQLRGEINERAPESPDDGANQIARIWRAMEAIGGAVPACPAWAVPTIERDGAAVAEFLKRGPDWTAQDMRDALNTAIAWSDQASASWPKGRQESKACPAQASAEVADWPAGRTYGAWRFRANQYAYANRGPFDLGGRLLEILECLAKASVRGRLLTKSEMRAENAADDSVLPQLTALRGILKTNHGWAWNPIPHTGRCSETTWQLDVDGTKQPPKRARKAAKQNKGRLKVRGKAG